MQLNLIKEIVSNIVGKPGEKLVDILFKKKNVNEFLIAKKLNLTINQTRNLLYKLSDRGLMHFIRKKDSKKGGWYTYFWTLDEKRSVELLKEQKAKKISELESDLSRRKQERFYYCPASNLEYNEEQALEFNFICPETGEVLQLRDNREEIDRLSIEISKLKILIEEVSGELEEINKKESKDKDRKLKNEIKKKEEEKKAKRKKRKREDAKRKKADSGKAKRKKDKKKSHFKKLRKSNSK